ncbi:MAG: ribosome biogenesis GTPase YlqF, partial [Acidaminococcaceae bacterium]
RLAAEYPQELSNKYKIDFSAGATAQEVLAQIAVARGCIRVGGVLDIDKVIQLVLRDFRTGRLGSFTLDDPEKK